MIKRSFTGRKILLVEDEMLISMLLEDLLVEFGCKVVGPAKRVSKGLELATREMVDGALLDISVEGQEVYPIAKALEKRGIPYAFITGYSSSRLPSEYRDRPLLEKPLKDRLQLAEILTKILR